MFGLSDRPIAGAVGASTRRTRVLLGAVMLLLTPLLLGAAGTTTVNNNSQLQALPSYQYSAVTRLGVAAAGDAAPLLFVPSGSACSLNAGAGDGGSQVVSADGKCWLAVAAAAGADAREWGAKGDGATNDSAAVRACFAASAGGAPCLLGNGAVYIVDNLALPENTRVAGSGILRRLPNSTNPALLTGDCVNLNLQGIVIDGNKANETVAADNLHCANYKNLRLTNITTTGAFGANGITLDTSVDQAADTYSSLNGVFATNNGANGIEGFTAAWKLQLNYVVATYNASYGAYFGPTGPANNVDSTLQFITVLGGDFSYNGNAGLAAQGFVTSYVGGNPSLPVYGPGVQPVSGALFSGVQANSNGYYGIVFQARESVLSNSVAQNNGTANGGFGGGVLANGVQTEINNVNSTGSTNPGDDGLDIGCGLGVHVVGGDYSANLVGINAGCTQYSSIRGATITANTAVAIDAYAAEAAGSGYGIPGYTETLSIVGNRIACPSAGAQGINVLDGGLGLEVRGNFIQGCTTANAMNLMAVSAVVKDNTVSKIGDGSFLNTGGIDYDAPSGVSGTLSVPVWAASVALYGANNISAIKTPEEVAVGGGAFSVLVSNGGSGYTTASVASWSGCATAPTGTVIVGHNGALTGYRFTTNGSGCVSPTVSFSIGSGATTQVYTDPLAGSFQKELSLVVAAGATLTMSSAGNLYLAAPISAANPNSVVRFHWGYAPGIYEISRVLH